MDLAGQICPSAVGRRPMYEEKGDDVGEDEGGVKQSLDRSGRGHSAAAQVHHRDPVVLAGVVPGAPGQVEGEQPGANGQVLKTPVEGQAEGERQVKGEETVGAAVFTTLINPKQGRPVVRCREQYGQKVHDPQGEERPHLPPGKTEQQEHHGVTYRTFIRALGESSKAPGVRRVAPAPSSPGEPGARSSRAFRTESFPDGRTPCDSRGGVR